jgi:hypothetical protein
MPTAVSSVISFLNAKLNKGEHNGPDLLARYLSYGCDMETQVNVSSGKGEPVNGKRSTYTDGIHQWFSYRIPRDAYSEAWFRDYEIDFPLDLHCDGIGSTGWDWKNKISRWVGFDFDDIAGHAAGVGVSKDDLERVREAAKALPYVEARRSTGGAGLHLYVLLNAIPIQNHTEHMALARCVLGEMSRDAGFDFSAQIDSCGGNMWLWHRKSSQANKGLELLKASTEAFTALPENWRDHIEVVSRRRTKVKVGGISDTEEDMFDQLASAHRRVPIDATHKMIQDELVKTGVVVNWVADHHLLQTHTTGLAKLMDHKEELGLHGVFQTNSRGTDLGTPNCFGFPLDHGGWKFFRFGPGASESPTWEQDGQGWTTCWFNVRATFEVAARSLGGRELCKGGFEFDTLSHAIEVAKLINPEATVSVEDHLKERKAVVKKSREGKLAIEIDKQADDERKGMTNWNSSDKKTAWTQVFNVTTQPTKVEVTDYDAILRCLETIAGESAGWSLQKRDQEWTKKPASEVKMHLQFLGHSKPEAEEIMGGLSARPWKLVMLPFQPEYPGNRQWNYKAPQYRFQPSPRNDGDYSMHPHWDMVFDHIGDDLTQYLKELDWAQQANIKTGADYLCAIFASILTEPSEPTPYIFLFGSEDNGKSTLHEAFELLVTSGVVKADRSLTNQSDFNGELAGAILCVVEEKDISKTPGALAKIKEAVTARKLSIRRMRTDSYMLDNMTHWFQCSNHAEACPVFEGDTRITMIHVADLDHDREIPKKLLMQRLEEEAPHFMRTLLDIELPPYTGRLRIPMVATEHKKKAAEKNRSAMEAFLSEYVQYVPGSLIPFADLYACFQEWLPVEDKHLWTRIKTTRALPLKFQTGTGTGNKTFLVNCAWGASEVKSDIAPFVVKDGKIIRKAS